MAEVPSSAWDILNTLLHDCVTVVRDGPYVGIRFHAGSEAVGLHEQVGTTAPLSAPTNAARDDASPETAWLSGAVIAARHGSEVSTEQDVNTVSALVDYAVLVLTQQRLQARIRAQEDDIHRLRLALETNRDIGAAVGIIMAKRQCTSEHAFGVLRDASQRSNLKVRDIAARIIYTGNLPS